MTDRNNDNSADLWFTAARYAEAGEQAGPGEVVSVSDLGHVAIFTPGTPPSIARDPIRAAAELDVDLEQYHEG